MPEADPWGNAGRPASAPTRKGAPALSRSRSRSGCCGDNEKGLCHPRASPPSLHHPACKQAGGSRYFFICTPSCAQKAPLVPTGRTLASQLLSRPPTSWGGLCRVGSRLATPTAWAKLPQLRGSAPHSPHFIKLELVGWVGRFPPVVSWIEAVQEGVRGEQVTGRRKKEINQQQPRLHVSLGWPLAGSEPRKGDCELYKVGLKTRMAFS